ncbi:hypothetical protein BCR43DRAFT_510274 [Syncephalastrum racemosum]|uniref:RxLR effector protein n=1 Tax=Syncephalastrum racemosum TaxID=13706 RepID=A0A1X2HU54_SYNRA|nr:hypothetical protein BCR43DRAFT_510219 [Syncephalastrum racemosum]ORZ03183.1 hypothetical protein BCR43DRAFT_510274 [Syncephalastrum racemosum]
MQLSYVLGLFALFATAFAHDTSVEGDNTAIGDTSGLVNNLLAEGALNDNSQREAAQAIDIDRHEGHWD